MLRAARASFPVFIVTLVAGCTIWAPAKSSSWKNATGAEQFERLWWQSVKDGDWNGAAKHMTVTYTANFAGATHNREQTLEALHSLKIADFSIGEVQLEPNGDTVVMTYVLNLSGNANGRLVALQNEREMTVWQRQKRGWAAIAHSGALGIQESGGMESGSSMK